MTKAEQDFINEYTRRLLVGWANVCIQRGDLPEQFNDSEGIYVQHALDKGWLTKTTPRRLTAKGFSTAASYLRR